MFYGFTRWMNVYFLTKRIEYNNGARAYGNGTQHLELNISMATNEVLDKLAHWHCFD